MIYINHVAGYPLPSACQMYYKFCADCFLLLEEFMRCSSISVVLSLVIIILIHAIG